MNLSEKYYLAQHPSINARKIKSGSKIIIGDRGKIILGGKKRFGSTRGMMQEAGKVATVVRIYGKDEKSGVQGFLLDIDEGIYIWTAYMFDKVIEF